MPDTHMVTRDVVARQLCDLIVESRPKLATLVTPRSPLTRELGIDSLAMIETVIRIEERFGIAMPDFEEFDPERVLTVEDLADMVLERLRA